MGENCDFLCHWIQEDCSTAEEVSVFFFLSLSATSYLDHRECRQNAYKDFIKPFTGEGDVMSFITKVGLVAALRKINDEAKIFATLSGRPCVGHLP